MIVPRVGIGRRIGGTKDAVAGDLTFRNYIAKISDIMSRPKTVNLSEVHKRILTQLCRHVKNGIPASVGDLVDGLHLAGTSSLVPTLKVMERNGFIQILGGGTRGRRCTLVLTPKGKLAAGIGDVPVLGSVPAGPLTEVLERCEDAVDLGSGLPYQPGDFLLVVDGHSMVGDGILPGDMVLLRPGVQVENGEIAAVHVGDQYLATLKHVCFAASSEIITLRASNANYSDVIVHGNELRIAGVFRGLIRPCSS